MLQSVLCALMVVGMAGAIAPSSASAQSQASPPPTATATPSPTPAPSPTPKPFVISGFADTAYVATFDKSTLQFVNGSNARVFDVQPNTASLQNLDVALTLNGALSGKAEVVGGNDADIIAAYGQPQGQGYNINQLYLAYTSGPFSLQAGKYNSLAGAEVIHSGDNTNFSRTYLFGIAVPFTHTGVRLTWAPSAKISLIGGINQGWDTVKSQNARKTIEAAVAYTPSSAVSLAINTYTGSEHVSDFPLAAATGDRRLLDIVATFKPSASWTLAANYDRGSQANVTLVDATGTPLVDVCTTTGCAPSPGTATWNGFAGYATYTFGKASLSARGETFHDPGGYRTGFDQTIDSGTLTFGYAPTAPLLFRIELRSDNSNQPVFARYDGTAKKTQSSIAFESIVKF